MCRMHRARGGAPNGNQNGNYKHGARTKEAINAGRAVNALLRYIRKCGQGSAGELRSRAAISVFASGRTFRARAAGRRRTSSCLKLGMNGPIADVTLGQFVTPSRHEAGRNPAAQHVQA